VDALEKELRRSRAQRDFYEQQRIKEYKKNGELIDKFKREMKLDQEEKESGVDPSTQLTKLNSENELLQAQCTKKEQELVEKTSEFSNLQKELEAKQNEIESLRTELNYVHGHVTNLDLEVKELNQELLDNHETHKKEMTKQVNETQQHLNQFYQAQAALVKEKSIVVHQKVEINHLTNQNEVLDSQITNLQKETEQNGSHKVKQIVYDTIKDELNHTTSELITAQQNIKELKQIHTNTQIDLDRLNSDLEMMRQERDEAKIAQHVTLSELESTKGELTALRSELCSIDQLAMANSLDPTDLPELPQLDPNQPSDLAESPKVNQTISLPHMEFEAIRDENKVLREHAKELEQLKETLGIIYMYIYILAYSSS